MLHLRLKSEPVNEGLQDIDRAFYAAVNTIIKEGDNCLDFVLQRSTISYFLKASSSKGRIVGRRAFSQRSDS